MELFRGKLSGEFECHRLEIMVSDIIKARQMQTE